jgi:hypothetical protein
MKTFFPCFALILFILSCEKESETALQYITNSKLENQNSSWFSNGDTTIFEMVRTTENSHSPDHSLLISRTDLNSNPYEFAFWSQFFTEKIPVGKQLTLRVWIKGVDLTGNGISLVVRTDGEFNQLQFATTQYMTTISGTFDWTEYTLDFPAVDPETKQLWIFLVFLDNTTGKVYFDDVTLTGKDPL